MDDRAGSGETRPIDPMTDSYTREIEVGLHAVREAAVLAQSVAATVDAQALAKRDRSPVTVADYGVQALICRALGEAFPRDAIIGEESAAALRDGDHKASVDPILAHLGRGSRGSWTRDDLLRAIDRGGAAEYCERFWTLDPIDGTKGFLRGDQYAVALALVIDGRVAVAILGCPNLASAGEAGTVFAAVAGGGAQAGSLAAGQGLAPIKVAGDRTLAELRVCESVESGHSDQSQSGALVRALGITADPVRLDSQAKYGVVARGDADLYLRLPTRADYVERIWDHAAGALVVSEAGGTVSDVVGHPLEFTHGRGLEANRGVVVSTGRHHARVIAALHELGVR